MIRYLYVLDHHSLAQKAHKRIGRPSRQRVQGFLTDCITRWSGEILEKGNCHVALLSEEPLGVEGTVFYRVKQTAGKLLPVQHFGQQSDRVVVVSADDSFRSLVEALSSLSGAFAVTLQDPFRKDRLKITGGERDELYNCHFGPNSVIEKAVDAAQMVEQELSETVDQYLAELRSQGSDGALGELGDKISWASFEREVFNRFVRRAESLRLQELGNPQGFEDLVAATSLTAIEWDQHLESLPQWNSEPRWSRDSFLYPPGAGGREVTAQKSSPEMQWAERRTAVREIVPSFPHLLSGSDWGVMFVALLSALEFSSNADRDELERTTAQGTKRLDENRLVKRARDVCRPSISGSSGEPFSLSAYLPGISKFRHLVRSIDIGVAYRQMTVDSGDGDGVLQLGVDLITKTGSWHITSESTPEGLFEQERARLRDLVGWYLDGMRYSYDRTPGDKQGFPTGEEFIKTVGELLQTDSLLAIWDETAEMDEQLHASLVAMEFESDLEYDSKVEFWVAKHFQDENLTPVTKAIASYYLRNDQTDAAAGLATSPSLRAYLRSEGLSIPTDPLVTDVLSSLWRISRRRLWDDQAETVRSWVGVFALNAIELEDRGLPRHAEIFGVGKAVDSVLSDLRSNYSHIPGDPPTVSRTKVSQVIRSLGSAREGPPPSGKPSNIKGAPDWFVPSSPMSVGQVLEEVAKLNPIDGDGLGVQFLKKQIAHHVVQRFGKRPEFWGLFDLVSTEDAVIVRVIEELFTPA